MNTGPGWYEVTNPRNATTCIALVYEDGSIYLPEGDALTREEFAFAAARGQVHRLVRADELEAESARLRRVVQTVETALECLEPELAEQREAGSCDPDAPDHVRRIIRDALARGLAVEGS